MNPFILEPYKSKDLFCDREQETRLVMDYLDNGRNITLISPRRLGKTGLIYRIFDEYKDLRNDVETLYMDISSTRNVEDFIKILSESVTSALKKQNKVESFFKTLGGLRPLVSYDIVTGKPEITLTYRNEQDRDQTLKGIFQYLENQPKRIILAIDEFQQIREYEESNMEALLRTYIQPLHNVRFIFCGSKKHTMTDIFSNAKKPFYESTTFVSLGKLNVATYAKFITRLFNEGGKQIGPAEVQQIIEWTRDHTFYTQALCNEVYLRGQQNISMDDVLEAEGKILSANRDRFLELQRLLTAAQWKLLKAIALEGSIQHPTSTAFIHKYKLGSGAAVSKSIKSLVEKELLLIENFDGQDHYFVYNVFFSRYLERN